MKMPDYFFRDLDKTEEESFRQWARDNWKRGQEPDDVWHPVVRDEWNKLTLIDGAAEATEHFTEDELEEHARRQK